MNRKTSVVTDWLNAQESDRREALQNHQGVMKEAIGRLVPDNAAVGIVNAEDGPATAAVSGSQLLLLSAHETTDDNPAVRCRRIALDQETPEISLVAQMTDPYGPSLLRARWTCEFGSRAKIAFTAVSPVDPHASNREQFVSRLAAAVGWQIGDDTVLSPPGDS